MLNIGRGWVTTMLNGLVLAGGQSRRMGQDKALMLYKGRTLLDHAIALLEAAGCTNVLISRNAPGYMSDLIADAGPLAGVHTALNAIGSNCELLVLPVDMPRMSAGLLQRLCNIGRLKAKACYVEGKMLPFYLPGNEDIIASLTHFLCVQEERKVVRFLDAIDAEAITDNDEALWLNVNTPADWPK